MKLQD